MGYYKHIEIEYAQVPKKPAHPCGDVVAFERTEEATTLMLSDGIGSGIEARIAAEMCISRMLKLLRDGYSLRKAFSSIAGTMDQAKGTDLPYAVFTVARILPDGVATILSYEMPPPIYITPRHSDVLEHHTITADNAIIGEANCHLEHGEGIIIMSDGITQAGLGLGFVEGWTSKSANQYIKDCLSDGLPVKKIPNELLRKALEHWKNVHGDDCSVALAYCRKGKIVNILTGPPVDRSTDNEVVKKFIKMEGMHVICGGTTSQVAAKALNSTVKVDEDQQSLIAPPKYYIEGIDLVTEGAVTLNQVYNIFDEDTDRFGEESGVTQLHNLLASADRINIIVGNALNPAVYDISFQQKGILTRQKIVPLLTQKLRDAGKLVVVEYL